MKKTNKNIWNEELFPKLDKNIQRFPKKNELRVKNAYSMTVGGKMSNHKMTNIPHKKLNQDISFSFLNINSEKLGEISLFGVLDGNGPFGKQISSALRDYIIDYFKNGIEMELLDVFYCTHKIIQIECIVRILEEVNVCYIVCLVL